MIPKPIQIIISTVLCLFITGCTPASYYMQSVKGHLSLMGQREAILDLLDKGELEESREKQLLRALQIRKFAVEELALPDNGSYQSFVELDQPFIVWNVVAAPKFSLTPKRWCFPIVGCVSYRGYYDEQDAEAFAASIDQQEFDVLVWGSRAYSTLGWFDDPLTSPMIDRGKILLAEVIFHELSHQILYFKSDASFNEAFASTVGEYGVRKWLKQNDHDALQRYEAHLQRKNAFIALLGKTAEELKILYSSDAPKKQMNKGKNKIFSNLKVRYESLKTDHWDGYNGYDRWFEKPVNNARLVSVAVYRDKISEFSRWLTACNHDFGAFYETMKLLKPLSKAEREQQLTGSAQCHQ